MFLWNIKERKTSSIFIKVVGTDEFKKITLELAWQTKADFKMKNVTTHPHEEANGHSLMFSVVILTLFLYLLVDVRYER